MLWDKGETKPESLAWEPLDGAGTIRRLKEALATEKVTAKRRSKEENKESQTFLEEEWWLSIVEEAKDAERKGNIRKLYLTLRKIGIKDASSIEDEFVSPEQFESHFSKVWENRFERPYEEVLATAENTVEGTDEKTLLAAQVEERDTLDRIRRWTGEN